MNTTEKAYKAINALLKKHEDLISYNVDDLIMKSKNHLFGIELKETFGLNIDPKNVTSTDSYRIDETFFIGVFGEKNGRKISWPDVKGQPKNETLLYLSFPTGAYIFGEDYPTDLFNQFWHELKEFKPKYSDTMNHSLYFELSNARDVFNGYKDLLNKYYEINRKDINRRKAEKIRAELEKLEKDIV